MKKGIFTIIVVLLLLSTHTSLLAQAKIKAYFNHPVNNAVSTGVNAIYLANGGMGDTIVAYINKAKYTLDIAQYDYNQDTYSGLGYANIANAVNAAYTRGVRVRWIYDGSASNGGLTALNAAIPKLPSPTGGSYTIMHNKFIIIDAHSTDPTDANVSTGSEDWSSEQMNKDYNNILFIQDSSLAAAYTAEFNMMWGDTGIVPNLTNSKFGAHKTDLGMHTFNIGGSVVELYFSPSDGTNDKILNSINSANTDVYFGVYTFTRSDCANALIAKKNAGVYVRGIVDSYSATASSSTYATLTSGLGSDMKEFNLAYIYHNKMMVVDPSDTCSDPQVLTGSHNWTTSANTNNDENTLIIHNDTLANIYYQAIFSDYVNLGGTLTPQLGCGATSVAQVENNIGSTQIFPNPAKGSFSISYQLAQEAYTSIDIYNIIGQKVGEIKANSKEIAGVHTIQYTIATPGLYIVRTNIGGHSANERLTIY
ncbi:MAG: phospholipase D-like domain-containing protein [Bacteroidota bacterium]